MPVYLSKKKKLSLKWWQWGLIVGLPVLLIIGALAPDTDESEETSVEPSFPIEEAVETVDSYFRDRNPLGWEYAWTEATGSSVVAAFSVDNDSYNVLVERNQTEGGAMCVPELQTAISPYKLNILAQRFDGSEPRLLLCK